MSCFCFQYYTFRKQYWTAVVSPLWQRVENELYFIVSCGSQITPSFLYPAEANCQIWVGENRIKSTELLGLGLHWVRQVLVGRQQGMVKKRQEATSFVVKLCEGLMKQPGRLPLSDERCGLPLTDYFLLIIWFTITLWFCFCFSSCLKPESPLLFPYYPRKSLHFVKRRMENIIDLCLQKPAVSLKKQCMPLWRSENICSMGFTYVNGHSF